MSIDSINSNNKQFFDGFCGKLEKLYNTRKEATKFCLRVSLYPVASYAADFFVKEAVHLGYLSQEVIRRHINIDPELIKPICELNFFQRIKGMAQQTPFLGVIIPFAEELVFREIFQKKLLGEKMHALLNKVSPQCAKIWKGPMGKVSRILLSNTLFALAHGIGIDKSKTHEEFALVSMCNAFGMGLVISCAHEFGGIFSSFGAHSAVNIARLARNFFGIC